MKIYVNPYASVVTISNNKYFYDSDSDKLYDIDILAAKYSLENQYSSPIYLKLVEKIIGSELTTLLLDKGFFLLEKPDITTQKSRTSGYLYYYSEDIASKYKNEIEKKKILILGAGAIGTNILWDLIGLGFAEITILDHDTVDISNLNRQMFYSKKDIGIPKIDVLKREVNQKYPWVNLHVLSIFIDSISTLDNILKDVEVDFVIKAIDSPINILSMVNESCVKNFIPYISGGFNGKNATIDKIYIPGKTPCMTCETRIKIDSYDNKTGGTTSYNTSILSGLMSNVVFDYFFKKKISNRQWDNFIIFKPDTMGIATIPKKYNNGTCDICKITHNTPKPVNNTALYIMGIIYLLSSIVINYINFKVHIPLLSFLTTALPITSIIWLNLKKMFNIDRFLFLFLMCYVPGIFFSIFNLFISQQTLKITPFINMLVVQMILLSSLLGLYLIIIYIIKYLGGVNFEKK